MKIQIASQRDFPSGLDLPWSEPLESWDLEALVRLSRGISRNVVRFVSYRDAVYAVKETMEDLAAKEFELLKELVDLGLPVVQPICLVTARESPTDPIVTEKGLLVTRYLDRSLPLRSLITSGATPEQASNLMDALAELLVRQHLAGFFWGDCSLSNTLFRLDAGRFAAYLVDVETGELHQRLSSGQRQHDIMIATENLAGELMDLDAGFGLAGQLDPVALAMSLGERYESLWEELTKDVIVPADRQELVDARVSQLNQLGFDVQEMQLETEEDGESVRVKTWVVESGYHKRLVHSLTGLEVQENQARRLLNDMFSYAAWQTGIQGQDIPVTLSAYRWFAEVYRPTIDAIPEALRGKLDEAEIFHQLLEHRWYMSEQQGREFGLDEVIPSYVANVLEPMPPPKVVTNALADSGSA